MAEMVLLKLTRQNDAQDTYCVRVSGGGVPINLGTIIDWKLESELRWGGRVGRQNILTALFKFPLQFQLTSALPSF